MNKPSTLQVCQDAVDTALFLRAITLRMKGGGKTWRKIVRVSHQLIEEVAEEIPSQVANPFVEQFGKLPEAAKVSAAMMVARQAMTSDEAPAEIRAICTEIIETLDRLRGKSGLHA
jgi:hypothetical protein